MLLCFLVHFFIYEKLDFVYATCLSGQRYGQETQKMEYTSIFSESLISPGNQKNRLHALILQRNLSTLK